MHKSLAKRVPGGGGRKVPRSKTREDALTNEFQDAIFFIKNLVPHIHRQVQNHIGAQCPKTGTCF